MTEAYDVLANLSTAFYSRFTALVGVVHNDLYSDLGGRLYEAGNVPGDVVYPYGVYMIVAAPKEKTFTEEFTNVILQLSIFSSASSSAEIKNAYAHASKLFDECALTITGSTLVWFRETNLACLIEEHTTPSGTASVRHYAIDFDVKTSLN